MKSGNKFLLLIHEGLNPSLPAAHDQVLATELRFWGAHPAWTKQNQAVLRTLLRRELPPLVQKQEKLIGKE